MAATVRPLAVSRHRSTRRRLLPAAGGRFGALLVPAVSLAPALLLTVLVQALTPAAQRLPTGAARFDLAGAWIATEPGALAGTGSWVTVPTLGRVQLGLLLRIMQAGQAQSVLAAAHGLMLALAALQVLLLWCCLRRLGAGALACGVGAAVLGAAPVAVEAHTAVSAVAVAVVWGLASVAVLVGAAPRSARVVGGVLAALALASAPVAAAALVPLAVGAAIRRAPRRRLGPALLGFGGTTVVLVAAMSAVALLPPTAASRDLAALVSAQGATPRAGLAALAAWVQADPVLLGVAVLAVAVAAATARGRSTAVVAVLLVGSSVWPLGADPVAPLLLLLPVVATLVALSVAAGVAALDHPLLLRTVLGAGLLAATAAVVVVGIVSWLAALGGLTPGAGQPESRVQRWVASSVPTGQTVLVGLAVWPDLAGATRARVGWYGGGAGLADVPSSVPWSRADYVVTDSSLPQDATGGAASALRRSLDVATFGSGGSAMSVRAIARATASQPAVQVPDTAAGRAAADLRRRAGAQLAANPRIKVGSQLRARLLAGEVDRRIAIVLAQFVTAHTITVTDFAVAAGDPTGVCTVVTISEIDGRAIPTDGTKTGLLLRFLSQLRGDLATRSIDATNAGVTASFAPDADLSPSG